MAVVAHHALLGLSVAALAGAGLRAAALATPDGLERAVAAAVIAASAAVVEALALGLVALGSEPLVLAGAALATFAASLLLPRPAASPLGRPGLILAAAAGAWAAWAVWLIRFPALGPDSIAYHLPQVLLWVRDGTPGSLEQVVVGLPVSNYPLTNEVLVTGAMGVSRSFVPASLWAPAFLALLSAAGWLGLRRLSVPRPAAGLAVAALCFTPTLTHWEQNGIYTDLPALAWLVSAGALCAASAKRAALLAPALLAAGLAAGTKTTALPLAALVVVLGLVHHRQRLRPIARPLLLAAAGALIVGSPWYVRNLIDHGSPLWPFLQGPWGDRLPVLIERAHASFLGDPGATLDHLGDDYLRLLGGGLVLLGGALAAPLVARGRAVWAAAAATAVSLLLWMNSPFTGVSSTTLDEGTLSTVRYLLPALAAAALTLALAARDGGAASAYGSAVLATATAVGAWQTFDLGFPSVPSPFTPLAGAAAGALALIALRRLSPPASLWRHPLLPAGLAVVAGGLVSIGAFGYVERHSRTNAFGSDVTAWMVGRKGFDDDGRTVAAAPVTLGPLAGDRLQNRLRVLSPRERCDDVRSVLGHGWVIVPRRPLESLGLAAPRHCLRGLAPGYQGRIFRVYGPAAGS